MENTKEIANTFEKSDDKREKDIATKEDMAIEDMMVVHIDDLTLVERINLLYSILRSTFDYEVIDEPEIKKTSWKLKHMISLFLKMYNIDN